MKEEWKDINRFENLYQISNLGRVKSLPKTVEYKDGRVFNYKEKIIVPHINSAGYLTIGLAKDKKKISKQIHRLVAEAFIPNPENKPCIDHINTNRIDNRIENLKWCTYKENVNNPITKERQITSRIKPVCQLSLDGQLIRKWDSAKEASIAFGCHITSISKVCREKAGTCKGYKWEYEY